MYYCVYWGDGGTLFYSAENNTESEIKKIRHLNNLWDQKNHISIKTILEKLKKEYPQELFKMKFMIEKIYNPFSKPGWYKQYF